MESTQTMQKIIKFLMIIFVVISLTNCSDNNVIIPGLNIKKTDLKQFMLDYFRAYKNNNYPEYIKLIYPGSIKYHKKIKFSQAFRTLFLERAEEYKDTSFLHITKTMSIKKASLGNPPKDIIDKIKKNIGCTDNIYWVKISFKPNKNTTIYTYFFITRDSKSGNIYLIPEDPLSPCTFTIDQFLTNTP